MDSKYELRRAGIADRMRELKRGEHASVAAAVAEEAARHAPEPAWQRALWEEDLAWFRRLEAESETDEQREFARQWRAEMERRLR